VARKKMIHFGIEKSSNFPELILTDRLRLSQVIRNLLSNAFKFTDPKGEVILRFRLSNEFKDACLEISVQDTGIGIPDEKQRMIFEAFQQADGSISRKYGGTGLGLSISKMLVGLMGGSLGLKSKEGEGSTFYIYLPVRSQPPALANSTNEKSVFGSRQDSTEDKADGAKEHTHNKSNLNS